MKCKICQQKFKIITNTHLKKHNLTVAQYSKLFPGEKVCFKTLPNLLSKDDPRYIKWRQGLKNRHYKYSKSRNKKISKTLKKKGIDNFKKWRDKQKRLGNIKSTYPNLPKDKETAELIGLVLGDGNLFKHERVEKLTIAFNQKYPNIIKRAIYLVKKSFNKTPTTEYLKTSKCARIYFYEKHISKRLQIPCGAKKNHQLKIPEWIWRNKTPLIHCLIGLFNAEGSYSIHKPTCTYNLQFSNINASLLKSVYFAIKMLKYNPNLRKNKVCLRRKSETESFCKLIKFRYYRQTN